MKALWEQTKGSGRLTQAQRDELLSAGSGLYFNMLDKHMENRSHVEDVSTRLGLDPKNLKNVVDQQSSLGRFQPFRNIPTTRDMQAPTQIGAAETCTPRPNPNAMSGTDAPGAGMMQPRSAASGAIGGGEPLGGAPGPAQYQYGQPGAGQPRGEFDMLAAGGMTTPGYGGPKDSRTQAARVGRFVRNPVPDYRNRRDGRYRTAKGRTSCRGSASRSGTSA